MGRTLLAPAAVLMTALVAVTSLAAQGRAKAPLAPGDVEAIATLLMLEDTRVFDAGTLQRISRSPHPEVRRRTVQAIGRIAHPRSAALLEAARHDQDVEVAATAVWAAGQFIDPAASAWVAGILSAPTTTEPVAREAAVALGKIRTPEARAALARYLSSAPLSGTPPATVGEALLAIGRCRAGGDLAPILRWTMSMDVEIRWRAAWALVRPGDPAALKDLLRLSTDPSADVRFRAVRGLIPHANIDPAPAAARLREAVRDPDRRVRTEALRTLAMHDDEASFRIVLDALDSNDPWLSVSAAQAMARHRERADVVVPRLAAAAANGRSTGLRRTVQQTLVRLGSQGQAAAMALPEKWLWPAQSPAVSVRRPQPQPLTGADYRRIVERWIVPDYNGAAKPRAVWETTRGVIELELYAGDAPLGVDYFVRLTEAGDLVGTHFSRVIPNFVAQQQPIPNAVVVRDEVSRRGLTRGSLSWASGLDWGRPGYTLGVTPHPDNEGIFTALGRVVGGMDVVERLEPGDVITAARMVR